MMEKAEDLKLNFRFEDLLTKYNIDLSNYAPASLERRIERFLSLHHFPNITLLSEKLLADKDFFDLFIKEITVNTTEMFRDPQCWKIIREEILPMVAEHPSIRIWHAGCSSGEEVYSMAVLLKEEGLLEKTKIVATDINREVMQTAMSGKYSLKHLELNTENYNRSGGKSSFDSYYETENSSFIMKNKLLNNVRFTKHDLSTGAEFSKFDIILCRNVMIYFNKQLQERVFSLFSKSLFKKSFVVIGKKESMAYFSGIDLFTEISAEERIYRSK
ncbi:MAG: protein-glutamate O-methyltransferase CheR [Bacteroidota bacterium]|nr:protein-glutamate O-methyltransferase CheR [Bacteroidota bacterium]